jgi:cadmium resistance protein CadD (predicted permease)
VASTWQTATTAVGLFAGTNIDDIVVLSALNVSRTAVGRPSSRDIWGGQYLGMAVLVAVSLLASRGLNLVNSDWVGLLGIIPLSLGSYRLISAIRASDDITHPSTVGVSGLPGVVALTAANGGDNIAAYTPVFGTQSNTEIWLTITTFAVCVAVWCLLGAALVTHRRVVAGVQSWGHWIVPVVYLAIGLWVLQKAGYL